ncbi:MAG: YhfC family intramembrane metalloprotease [Anaerolineae bacterium]|nr:YhfC family intramembrane metalloprotease [Anaerolineae bacterium]
MTEPTSGILYVLYPLQGILMIAIGIVWGVVLTRKFALSWRLYALGAITFVLSQVVHIPLNSLLTTLFQKGILPAPPPAWKLPFNAITLGFTAGLCEEVARYCVYRWWAKDARSWRKGMLFGAGHGGIEAIILGGLVLFAFFQMVVLRTADLSTMVPADQLDLARQQVSDFWSAKWYMPFLGVFERFFTLPVHVGLSLIVLQVFTRKQIRWLWLAIGWHMLIDALAVFIMPTWGVFAAEATVFVVGCLSLVWIWRLYRPEPAETSAEPPPPPLTAEDLIPIAETTETLQDTRYTER